LPDVLVSLATSVIFAFEYVPMALPICVASIGVNLSFINPRTPELPNSFIKFSLLVRL
jgi:hypothetical protein